MSVARGEPHATLEALPLVALDRDRVPGQALDRACWEFEFYVTGHGVDPRLVQSLAQRARSFCAQPLERKLQIAMSRAGRARRGYFPVGGELTSGRPDRKEGASAASWVLRIRACSPAGPCMGAIAFPTCPGSGSRC